MDFSIPNLGLSKISMFGETKRCLLPISFRAFEWVLTLHTKMDFNRLDPIRAAFLPWRKLAFRANIVVACNLKYR